MDTQQQLYQRVKNIMQTYCLEWEQALQQARYQSMNHGAHNSSSRNHQLLEDIAVRGRSYHQTQRRGIRNDRANEEKNHYQKTYLIKKKKKPTPKKNQAKNKKKTPKKQIQSSKQIQVIQIIDEQFTFKQSLSKLIGSQVGVTFEEEPISAFQKLWQDKKLIAIHCLRFDQQPKIVNPQSDIMNFIKVIYQTPQFIETFNKYLINFGVDPHHFDFNHYTFMRELIAEEQVDYFKLIILRYDASTRKVVVFKKCPMTQIFKFSQPESFTQLIKQFTTENNRLNERSFYKVPQMSKAQKLKLQQDRRIRTQQQEQYLKNLQKKPEEKIKEPQQVKQIIDIPEQRRLNREKMPQYSQPIQNAISLKIRLPNSSTILIQLPKIQTVQYIYDFIQNYQEDIGFEDDDKRQFDIILPLERTSISDKKEDTLQKIFGESEMETIAIKEL